MLSYGKHGGIIVNLSLIDDAVNLSSIGLLISDKKVCVIKIFGYRQYGSH